ncbi:MAG TPA: GAF domain-containing protein [Thermoleophilaceae bacterium]
MITLASPPLGEGQAGFDGLAVTAQRSLGSEAIVIVSESGDRPPVVVGAEGLTAGELAELERGLGERVEGVLEREFGGVLSADAVLDGERIGAIHALKRVSGPFENEDLIGSFASQVATALGRRRRPPTRHEGEQTLSELDQLVLSVHNLEDLSRAVAEAVGPIFSGARTAVMIADSQRSVLQMSPGSFGAPGEVAASHQVSVFDTRSNSARVFSTGQPYISNASGLDPGIRKEFVDAFGIERLLSVPLHQVGVLHIANKPSDFTLEDLERAGALARRIANVVELATTLFRLRRQQRLEGILSDVAVSVASGERVQDFRAPALEELCVATEASLVAIVPEDPPPIVARSGACSEELERIVLKEAGSDPGMRAYVVGPRKVGDPGWAAFYMPVHLGRQRVGTLAALRVRGEPFDQAERRSLVRMANLAALSRASERYQQQRAELARLQERQRIADDLHDDVAQILFAAQLSLDSILQRHELDDATAAAIARARGLLIRGDTAIRTVIHRLSSPSAADVATRLASVVASVEDEFSMAVHLQIAEEAGTIAKELRRPVSDALVKVARESLVNVAKHAGPCQVGVTLEVSRRDRLVLIVEDDGRGSPEPDGEHHHGLTSLRRLVRDQGGSMRVSRGVHGGTKVTASVPLDGEHGRLHPADATAHVTNGGGPAADGTPRSLARLGLPRAS